eukprot:TRINITY_DN3752_c1_g1_i1.p1 TRINITY_DN3752_c1_g1~~TRINITY_DN3752_c1_g1_i1.p1  ORF type:complete len:401 (-),score=159.61 TRINITY_DN3752_c1_g1_i1:22-1224(-)
MSRVLSVLTFFTAVASLKVSPKSAPQLEEEVVALTEEVAHLKADRASTEEVAALREEVAALKAEHASTEAPNDDVSQLLQWENLQEAKDEEDLKMQEDEEKKVEKAKTAEDVRAEENKTQVENKNTPQHPSDHAVSVSAASHYDATNDKEVQRRAVNHPVLTMSVAQGEAMAEERARLGFGMVGKLHSFGVQEEEEEEEEDEAEDLDKDVQAGAKESKVENTNTPQRTPDDAVSVNVASQYDNNQKEKATKAEEIDETVKKEQALLQQAPDDAVAARSKDAQGVASELRPAVVSQEVAHDMESQVKEEAAKLDAERAAVESARKSAMEFQDSQEAEDEEDQEMQEDEEEEVEKAEAAEDAQQRVAKNDALAAMSKDAKGMDKKAQEADAQQEKKEKEEEE